MNVPLATAAVTLKASGAETASTTGAPISLGPLQPLPPPRSFLLVTVAVTAVSGTPTLLVVLEGSQNAGGTWSEVATVGVDGLRTWGLGSLPSVFTGVASSSQLVAPMAMMRSRSIIGGGSPSVTYSVTGQFVMDPSSA